jgi:CHAT domain-containing protein
LPATATSRTPILSPELLASVFRLKTRRAQNKYLSQHPELIRGEVVSFLAESVRSRSKTDPGSTVTLAEIAVAIARRMRDQNAIAQSMRAMGNALYLSGKNQAAVECHTKAARIFATIRSANELARTLNASIQPLILCGQYARAISAAKKARRIFLSEKNQWRAARVDLNTGNIFQRQGQYAEALEFYQRACDFFSPQPEQDPEAYAVALHNSAMCRVLISDFPRAENAFQDARRLAQAHEMPALVGQIDYNIASLHHLEGENTRAIEMLLSTREHCRKNGDHYHAALCQLDLSEIYLELNQSKQAEEMAQQAAADFQKLAMAYEAGKSLANRALALWQQGGAEPALELFATARELFVQEGNAVWTSRMDFYRAVILLEQKQYAEARRICLAAFKIFRRARIPYGAVQCQLLLAHLFLRQEKPIPAGRHCGAALKHLQGLELPALNYQARHLMGRILMATGRTDDAFASYEAARQIVENLRTDLSREELRISFMKNRLAIYEELVEMCLKSAPRPRLEEAFQHIEQSKSRSLRDLMLGRSEFHLASNGATDSIGKVQRLRAEIHSLSRQYEAEQLGEGKRSPERAARIQAQIRKCEDDLLRTARDIPLPIAESAGLASPNPVTIKELRAVLSPDSTLIEYFQIGDDLVAVVLRTDSLDIVPVSAMARVADLAARLQFQLAKFRLGQSYIEAFGKSLLRTTLHHLKQLHAAIIEPIRELLKGNHLLVVPHSALHAIPFSALFDGERYLIDSFKISFAPSATIFHLCQSRFANRRGHSLVLGIPDANAPTIADEVRKVVAAIPQSDLFLGESATTEVLRRNGQHSRLIHIATHGYFRQDNPMFSGIRLGDGILSLYDLYQMKLPAELITLSGCATGLNVVADGDELLGLLRGLIYAGAQAALLSLWDVQDQSTAEFMTLFYAHLDRAEDKADALRHATLGVRKSHPHPYYWAPFFLVGK